MGEKALLIKSLHLKRENCSVARSLQGVQGKLEASYKLGSTLLQLKKYTAAGG